MKIYGDEASTRFKTYIQEAGTICGHNDVVVGDERTTHHMAASFFFGPTNETITTRPKLYLHIFNSFWSSVTGILREYCLPWRWKAAYLDKEDGSQPQRILACTSVQDGELSDRLNAVIGQSLFVINLTSTNQYQKMFGQEYLRIPSQNGKHQNKIIHPLGEWAGSYTENNNQDDLCHMYRIRGVFSLLKYHLLKNLSSEWEEVAIQTGQVSENVLIERNNRTNLVRVGLIHQN